MGEAKRRAAALKEAREEAYGNGRPFPAPQACPKCGNRNVGFAKPNRPLASHDMCLHGVCPKCETIWEAWPETFVEDPVCADPCDNCAFRPGSDEQADKEKWREVIGTAEVDPVSGLPKGRFYCHKYVPIDRHTLEFKMPRRPDGSFDTAKMRTCSGFLRAFWALAKKAERKADEPV